MKKILIATEKPFAPVAIGGIREIIREAGYELVVLEKYTEKSQLLDAVKYVNALIIRSDVIDKTVIGMAEHLEIVVRAGAGYDNIDLEACSAKGIVAMNTPGQNSNAVAELAYGLMLYIIRNGFDGSSGSELRGKKLGIHAYGNVGRFVGSIARGFGMEVHAHDPFASKSMMETDGVICEEDVKDLYRKCQFVSLHLPLNSKTRNMIHYDLLSLMPHQAVLVNTARKEIVHEPSLVKMFADRQDFRYASDIAPDCAADIKQKYPGRYVFTAKKMGAQTFEANVNAGLAAARQIVNYFRKGDVTFKVN